MELTATAQEQADIAAERVWVKADLASAEEEYNEAVGILTKANESKTAADDKAKQVKIMKELHAEEEKANKDLLAKELAREKKEAALETATDPAARAKLEAEIKAAEKKEAEDKKAIAAKKAAFAKVQEAHAK